MEYTERHGSAAAVCHEREVFTMTWEWIVGILLAAVMVIALVVSARRTMHHNYTIGSGMFKRSENNLEEDKHLDPADYNYYDDQGLRK